MTTCTRCGTELVPDNACPETEYAFDNALWIAFHGGYGMFVDNIEASLPTNSDDRWLADDNGEYLLGETCTCAVGAEPGHFRWDSEINKAVRCETGEPDEEWRSHELGCPRRNPVDDPDYEPEFPEKRILPGRPDYEVVLCHECAHDLWDAEPWLNQLVPARFSHSHRTEWLEAHPDHDCHEHHSRECNDYHLQGRITDVTCICGRVFTS